MNIHNMLTNKFYRLALLIIAVLISLPTISSASSYCDTSAGRSVLNSGGYSKHYCRKTAVMDIQGFNGCCTWSGGVLTAQGGTVVCNNGTVSPICSIQTKQHLKNRPWLKQTAQ